MSDNAIELGSRVIKPVKGFTNFSAGEVVEVNPERGSRVKWDSNGWKTWELNAELRLERKEVSNG